MSADRLPVVSTRMNCRALDQRLKSVQKGLSLLKCKSDALQLKVRATEEDIKHKQTQATLLFKDAFRRFAKAELCGAETELFLKACIEAPPTVTCELVTTCGATIATITLQRQSEGDALSKSGYALSKSGDALCGYVLWKSGYVLRELKSKFDALLGAYVEISTMQGALTALRHQLEATNKRKNSLEHKMIPRLESTVSYISAELDEFEREEFYRLKKLQEAKGREGETI